MKRIVIIGATGSGKSTLADQIGVKLALPVIELDDIFWQPGWVQMPHDAFYAAADKLTSNAEWVVNGNYNKLQAITWGRADTVIWLDYPFAVVLRQLLHRSFRRMFNGEPSCGENHETLSRFLSRRSILLWLLKTYWVKRRQYATSFLRPDLYPQAKFIRLRSRAEKAEFLHHLTKDAP